MKKYGGAFLCWKRWALSKHDDIPILPGTLLYLAFLTQTSSTYVPVEEAVNALSWVHQLAAVEDPTQCNFVRQLLDGTKQMLAHKVQKKEPITPEMLQQVVDNFAGKSASLSDVKLVPSA